MKLSTKGRYAVMAMADLAAHGREGRAVPLAEISARQEISLSYLEQLFAKLRRGGLVRSVRGPVIRFGYRILLAENGHLLCEGETVHVVIGRDMKRRAMFLGRCDHHHRGAAPVAIYPGRPDNDRTDALGSGREDLAFQRLAPADHLDRVQWSVLGR